MKSEIENKLRRLLSDDQITDEAKVTYLLVECRKLLEHDKTLKASLPTLEFYLNWGLHIQLNRAGARKFLELLNPVLTLDDSIIYDQAQHDALDALLKLNAFRSELRTLLAGIGADLSICDDFGRWLSFLHLYSHVVENSELVLDESMPGRGSLGLAVKKLTICPISRVAATREVACVFPMHWEIEYQDGRTGLLELSDKGLWGAKVTVFPPTFDSYSVVHL